MDNLIIAAVIALIAVPCCFGIKKMVLALFKGSCGCDGGGGCACGEQDKEQDKSSCCCTGKKH